MVAKVSEQEYIERINAKPNIIFVRWDGEYKSSKTKAVCRCEIDGYEWSATLSNIIPSGGCPQCVGKRKWTASERIEHINALPNIRFVRWDDEFKGNKSKAVCRCDIDGCEWSSMVDHLINSGSGCPRCYVKQKQVGDQVRIDQIDAIPNIRFLRWDGKFKGVKSKAVCRCEIDGYEWSVAVDDLIYKNRGCPYCARYGKTEEKVAPNITVEIPTDVKPAFDLLNW